MVVRPAAIADLGDVRAIVDDAYTPAIARIGGRPGPMLDDYAARIEAGSVWVAEWDGGIGGLMVLLERPDHLLLDNVAVRSALHGRGIGKALMRFAEREARLRGRPALQLYTHDRMTENIAMYAALGWQETGRATQSGYDRVFFHKVLA